MAKQMNRWTKADTDRAREMIASGAPDIEFINVFARTRNAACSRVAYADDPEVRRLTRVRARKGRAGASNVIAGQGRSVVPEHVQIDADRRRSLDRSLTGAFFGDPPPGYSALDRRVASISPGGGRDRAEQSDCIWRVECLT